MKAAQLTESIRQVVGQVVMLVHPLRIILFGSAAEGRFGDDSDLDFLVVVPEDEHPEDATDKLNLRVQDRPLPCDFVVVTESTLDRNKDNPGLIYGQILARGREVYAV